MRFELGPALLTRAQIASATSKFPFSADSETPAYLIIHDKIYDVSDFIYNHPGGLVITSKLGEDASDVFDAFHIKDTYEVLANFYVGDLVQEEERREKSPGIQTTKDFAQCIRDLKQQFMREGLFQSRKSFFFYHFVINMMLLAMALVLFSYRTFLPLLLSSFFMALFWQQCGWLSHDFLHHSVFEQRRWNNAVGYFLGGVCQGFSVGWWKDKHNTHHSEPNIHALDPDINTLPFLAWSKHALTSLDDLSAVLVSHQTWLYVPIILFARISWLVQSVLFATIHCSSRSGLDRFMEQIALGIHWCWYVAMLVFLPTTGHAFFYFFATQAFGGLLLATVFALNHNGMQVFSKQEEKAKDFFSVQVLTGRDVHPSRWMNWFCGGLNFQIEHHLFPTMPRHSYPKIQSIISKLCSDFDLHHHTTGFWEGTKEVFFRLHEVSTASSKLLQHSKHSESM